jgi:Tfp pilus assembly protein PilO
MLNLSQIKVEDILKKGDNIFIIAILVFGLIFALKINAKDNKSVRELTQKIGEQKKTEQLFLKINALAKDFQEYRKNIFFEKDSSQVVDLINDWARSANVQITTLRPQALREVGQFIYFPLELEAKGDYYTLGQFLSLVENYEGFIEVAGLNIRRDTSQQQSQNVAPVRLAVNVSLAALTLKDFNISDIISKRR